jgi:hypothetical protein
VARETAELGERTQATTVRLFVPHSAPILAIVDGHLEDAVLHLQRVVERADAWGLAVRGRQFLVQTLLAPALYLGRPSICLAALEEYESLAPRVLGPAMVTGGRAICLAYLGRLERRPGQWRDRC